MHKIMLILPLLAAACTATAADRERMTADADATQVKLDRALAGYTPDSAASGNCLNTSFYRGSQSTEAYGRTLLFKVSPNLIFRTDTSGGCERVGGDEYLVTSTPSTQLCRGDIARTVDRTIRREVSGCSFGDFQAYRKR